jgi:C4-dicarboxylate-specific signal transduction histidine kinase
MTYRIQLLLLDRLGPRLGMLGAGALILLVVVADYATGYEVRLSILYLAPIALATWTAGAAAGVVAAAFASLCWLFSFRSEHFYAHQVYYFWEAVVMLGGFLAVVLLLARLRRALREADERFARVLEEMQAAAYVIDEQRGELLYANPEMARLINTATTASVRRFEAGLEGEPAAAEAGSTEVAGAFAANTVRHGDSGRWYLMQAGGIPWGSRSGVKLKVLTDITQQKTAEAMRQKHLEVLHQSARLSTLAEIASTLAHEINQPLMVIATYTDACQRLMAMPGYDHAEVVAALGKCRAQASRAARIIERLRDFIRQRQHRPEPCDANAIASEAAEMMHGQLAEARLALDLILASPAPRLVADRTLLIQVLVNLLGNAIDAMQGISAEARRISLTVSASGTDEVLFSVADCGVGLDETRAANLFVPFFTSKPDGLGLGLAICRSVAEAHGGRLWAQTNPPGGTVFHLAIPLRQLP